jgi:hypothetical protein
MSNISDELLPSSGLKMIVADWFPHSLTMMMDELWSSQTLDFM